MAVGVGAVGLTTDQRVFVLSGVVRLVQVLLLAIAIYILAKSRLQRSGVASSRNSRRLSKPCYFTPKLYQKPYASSLTLGTPHTLTAPTFYFSTSVYITAA